MEEGTGGHGPLPKKIFTVVQLTPTPQLLKDFSYEVKISSLLHKY